MNVKNKLKSNKISTLYRKILKKDQNFPQADNLRVDSLLYTTV